ncbi:hypothetical protein AMS68_000389 [Peltaster fructicola]|uniref:FAD-binding FR-type domain-containing protein n=1 Tax=Peltaster fructicola TaxID=286661 RepID=A0A6H0XJH9_9PEZI|nr:hypothetical protein AMS68_000389 [Peltaster fructicola]
MAPRRHSLPASPATTGFRHKNIPHCATSHPDDPIPVEPAPLYNISPSLRAQFNRITPRSSGESLNGITDETSDSDAPSTPPTERSNHEENADKVAELQKSPVRPRMRRASTTYASSADDVKRLLGDGSGTKFLQRFCCGKGCCKNEALPALSNEPDFKPIQTPDNDAFRFLALNLGILVLDTPLTKIVELPEPKITLASIRKESISHKFPAEAHPHDAATVNVRPPEYMKPHPPYDVFSAPIYHARELTKPGAEKRTFHFDIDVTEYPEEGGVDFKVGGAIGVCPSNDPVIVDDIMNQLGIPRFVRDKPVRLITAGGRWPTIWGDDIPRELVTTRREILTWTVDISSVAPTRPLLRVLAEHAHAEHEKKILLFLCSAQGQSAFCDLRTGPHITLQQLLYAFPSSKPPFESLLSVLGQLMPRFYSLSNDPHVSSSREGLAGRRLIEMAVTVHETQSHDGGKRTGVGSGFMERIAKQFVAAEDEAAKQAEAGNYCLHPGEVGRKLDLRVPMFRGLMANPLSREFASDGPMMLIGAGVGMAPFRGFILNRLKNANCANKIWLVQGVRDSMLDEIYQGELGAHEHEIKKVVQSRVHAPPPVDEDDNGVENPKDDARPAVVRSSTKQNQVAKYVQDEVRLQADIVWFVINAADGRIFVCGSSKGMGEGVETALIDVAMDKGNLDYETAKQFWEQKKEAGQYIAETW